MNTKLMGGVAAATLVAFAAQAQDDYKPTGDEQLTIVSWGGAYSMSQEEAYHKPYEEKTGVEILNEDKSANALAGIRSQVEAGNVTWDVVDMLQADALRACDEGLLVEIDHDEWFAEGPDGQPATEDFLEDTLGDCFVPSIVYATMFAYNTEAFDGEGPQTIADIWNCEQFPGTRALQKIPQKNLEWALIADGVPAEEVYDVLATDEGQDRAFESLEKLRSQDGCDVIWWSEGAQPPQMLADEEAAIATAYNGRIFNAQVSEDQPFEIIWDNQMFEVDGWVVPAGNEDQLPLIKDYLKFATDTQRLADQAKYISYGPARKSSDALVSTHEETGVDMAPHMPTNPENFENAIRFDTGFWADYGDALEERFTAWLSE